MATRMFGKRMTGCYMSCILLLRLSRLKISAPYGLMEGFRNILMTAILILTERLLCDSTRLMVCDEPASCGVAIRVSEEQRHLGIAPLSFISVFSESGVHFKSTYCRLSTTMSILSCGDVY
jgi:hypothetical protein